MAAVVSARRSPAMALDLNPSSGNAPALSMEAVGRVYQYTSNGVRLLGIALGVLGLYSLVKGRTKRALLCGSGSVIAYQSSDFIAHLAEKAAAAL